MGIPGNNVLSNEAGDDGHISLLLDGDGGDFPLPLGPVEVQYFHSH